MTTNKDVNFKVNVDTDDAVSNVNNLEQSIADVSIASLESAKSVSEIKKALKEADNVKLSGTLSAAELQKLSAAMGQAKDQIADLREETAALGGTRTEILSANFARLKESIANLDLDKFKSALSGIKVGLFGTEGGFKAVGKAVIASGIGALVGIVGLLITNFDTVKKVLMNLIPGFSAIADFIGNLVNKVTDFMGLTSQAMRDNEEMIKRLDDTLKFSGDKTDEWGRKKLESAKKLREDIKALNDRTDLDEQEKAARMLDLRRIHNNNLIQADKDREAAIKKVKDDAHAKELAASEKRAQERAQKEAENEANIAIWRKESEDKLKAQYAKEAADEAAKNEKAGGQTSKDVFKTLGLPTPADTNVAMATYKKTLADKVEAEKTADAAVLANKESIKNSTVSVLDEVGAAIGKQEEIGKVTALGQIAFDTGTALTKALSVSQSPTPDNVATGGIAGIAKYAALAAMITVNSIKALNIVRSKKVSSGGGGGAAVSGGTSGRMPTATQLPQFQNDMSNLGNSRLNPNQMNNQTKVVITQRELTDNQKVEINQKELSRLG